MKSKKKQRRIEKTKYRIKIIYDTGDSFHTYENVEAFLEESYDSLEKANEVLNQIEAHYKYVETQDEYDRGWYFTDRKMKSEMERVIEDAKKQPWYVPSHPNTCIKLPLNNGKKWQFSAFWCGYFEQLNNVRVVSELPKKEFR